MERQTVASSALRSVGYDADAQILEIEFPNGRIYQYSAVPESVHAWLLRSADKGGLFNRLIRDRYDEKEVTPPAPTLDLAELLAQSVKDPDS